MANRIRRMIESAVFAGMKPNASSRASHPPAGLMAKLRGRLERFLNGTAPSDPLYLSNRTWKQKLKLGLAVGVPCLVLLGAMALALSNIYTPEVREVRQPTPAEIVATLLPSLEETAKTETNRQAEILNVVVEKNGPVAVSGTVRNKTNRPLSVEFVLELADVNGSKLGGVRGSVENAPAGGLAKFRIPVQQQTAVFALVREIKALN